MVPGVHLLVVPQGFRPGQDIVLSPAPWGLGRVGGVGEAPESNQVPSKDCQLVEGRTVSLPNTVPGMQWVLNKGTCNFLCFQHCYKRFIDVNLFNPISNPARQVLLLPPGGKSPCLRQPSQQEVQVGLEPRAVWLHQPLSQASSCLLDECHSRVIGTPGTRLPR